MCSCLLNPVAANNGTDLLSHSIRLALSRLSPSILVLYMSTGGLMKVASSDEEGIMACKVGTAQRIIDRIGCIFILHAASCQNAAKSYPMSHRIHYRWIRNTFQILILLFKILVIVQA
jgi:hypothetical protein